ncbi:type III toxin-antitoxin system ToxN/AbiQ family toxin, partial [Butyrivibrio sp. INlla16]|uniref:type III toxin-antitoxin system ToxN/AbiQ family toxin n=1 Tax=Butyrivibrio sp. INlla16 TaxID=1520807 RepID=UPI00088205B6
KSQVDFIKIFDDSKKNEDGTSKLIGVLNINNMIPVIDSVIQKVDLTIHKNDAVEIKNHKELMQKQLKWCRDHADTIENRANKVYDLVTNKPDKNRNLVNLCDCVHILEACRATGLVLAAFLNFLKFFQHFFYPLRLN